MSNYEITMQDINGYLATKSDNEVIGVCMDGNGCLAHNTLTWKYGLEDDAVLAVCTHAWVSGNGVLDFPEDVEEVVHKFDMFKNPDSPVTKAEFMAAMGEDNGLRIS